MPQIIPPINGFKFVVYFDDHTPAYNKRYVKQALEIVNTNLDTIKQRWSELEL